MKRILSITLIICTILIYAIPVNAQKQEVMSNVNQKIESLYDEISELDEVSTVYVGKALLNNLGRQYYGGLQLDSIRGKINSINIINSENSSTFSKIKQTMNDIIKIGNMELLTKIIDDGDKTEMYLQKDGDYIVRFLMINIESDEISIIEIVGRFTSNDISNLTKNKHVY